MIKHNNSLFRTKLVISNTSRILMTWSIEITSPLEQVYDVEFTGAEAELKDGVEERWSFVVDCSVVEVAGADGVLEDVVVELMLAVI